jgi:uncharacterized membrane protein YraQ (UPF0718 family)
MLVFSVVLLAAIIWAKWLPYTAKTAKLLTSHTWSGDSSLDAPGATPSLRAGWEFTVDYSASVWKALIAALVIAAMIDALVPRRWLTRALSGRGGSLRGGLAALPFMMCTCCTAPIAVTLRRGGIPTSSALAYWVGNPLLNPAVLVFLALVAPWEWTAARLLAGVVLTFGVTAMIGRLVRTRSVEALDVPEEPPGSPPARFARSLGRMLITLVPEYFAVVFAVGALRGWLFPMDGVAHWGVLAALIAAVAGTLMVIPTAGEIPVLLALAAAGASGGVIGVLLVALPAISLPSIVMVGRTLTWRVTWAMAGGVAVVGLLTGSVLALA